MGAMAFSRPHATAASMPTAVAHRRTAVSQAARCNARSGGHVMPTPCYSEQAWNAAHMSVLWRLAKQDSRQPNKSTQPSQHTNQPHKHKNTSKLKQPWAGSAQHNKHCIAKAAPKRSSNMAVQNALHSTAGRMTCSEAAGGSSAAGQHSCEAPGSHKDRGEIQIKQCDNHAAVEYNTFAGTHARDSIDRPPSALQGPTADD